MVKKRKTIIVDVSKIPDYIYAMILAQGFKALMAKRKAARLKKKRRSR